MRIRLESAIVCEGKYDKIRLAALFDTPIIPVDGFQIYSHPETIALLKKYAEKAPVILATDPDRAGFQLRTMLTQMLGKDQVIQVYIPALPGREMRKKTPSREGLLGVEGVSCDLLLEAFSKAGVLPDEMQGKEDASNIVPKQIAHASVSSQDTSPVTTAMLYEDGFVGGDNAADKRRALLTSMGLPPRMSTSQLLCWCNRSGGLAYYRRAVSTFEALWQQQRNQKP